MELEKGEIGMKGGKSVGYISKLIQKLELRRELERTASTTTLTATSGGEGNQPKFNLTNSQLTLSSNSSSTTTTTNYFSSSSSSNSSVTDSGLSITNSVEITKNVKNWRIKERTSIPIPILVPGNFAMVEKGLYRSSFPGKENWNFLKDLGLKSILTLVLEDYPQENLDWLEEQGIQFFQFGIPGNKEPFVHIPDERIISALAAVLDTRNHPMLIHCNKGKHRTGCLIGCLRKLQSWSSTATFSEYRQFSYPKSRSMDQQFIELFDSTKVWEMVEEEFLPNWGLKRVGGCES